MVAFYPGDKPGGIPGLLGDPYYWWEAGGMFGALIDYWYYTGDDQYNNITTQALLFQLSDTYNYMPPNQTKSEGNDDQIFWAFAVMTAAEYKYPNPPAGTPAWVSIAAAVFNSQALRWDPSTCGGGLRWQIFTFNNGYNYKNSPSNGGFLNLAARLYAYTGNQTYADWVDKTWDWMTGIGLLGTNDQVFDGTDDTQNCTQLDHVQWTYSAGMMLNAAAVMWNATSANSTGSGASASEWEARMNGIWKESAAVFFKNKVMLEIACEPGGNCNIDQQRCVPCTTLPHLHRDTDISLQLQSLLHPLRRRLHQMGPLPRRPSNALHPDLRPSRRRPMLRRLRRHHLRHQMDHQRRLGRNLRRRPADVRTRCDPGKSHRTIVLAGDGREGRYQSGKRDARDRRG